MKPLVIASVVTLGALPLWAADFEPPAGCEVTLTVQSRSCAVSNVYRCEGAPEGDHWVAVFGGNGPESLTHYDPQYQWLEANYAWDQSREVLLEPAEDPIDTGALTSEGVDTFRFDMHRRAPGEDRIVTIVGADVLTGESTEIDGVSLMVVATDLQILTDDGQIEYQSRGRQYFDPARRLFFLGVEEVLDVDGSATPYDNSPVDFIAPGEPGFASTLPLYECEEFEASLETKAG